MKWVLMRRLNDGAKEYIKNTNKKTTFLESQAHDFGSFEGAETFKKDKLSSEKNPFYIQSIGRLEILG